ncbi:MAG TPA: M28 family peptidase [Solirubrobacteraceae bacterium]|nr:M28 family peptidase [Solirubrobacteraceae bacterium]
MPEPAQPHPALREVIERLAQIERGAGSPGEAAAADWLFERFKQAGCDTEVQRAEFYDGYARPNGTLTAAAALAGMVALRRRGRVVGGLLAAACAALIADDAANATRAFRRLTSRPRPTQNVVALTGDLSAKRTLVVLGHHDAAPSGLIFDDRLQSWFGRTCPGVLERFDTSVPLWWLVLAGPVMTALGAAARRPALVRGGVGASLLCTAAMADIQRSPIVPGANDNLSSVALMVALAETLREHPIHGLRVMLVSCGAEEVVQGGIYSFARRHFPELDLERTWFLGLETLGSPILALIEGEGPIVMEDYPDIRFRDLVAQAATDHRIPLRRGLRARSSTDAMMPSRAGYPTATLVSVDRHKALSNYHQMSDTPENINYATITQALQVTEAVARELATHPWL